MERDFQHFPALRPSPQRLLGGKKCRQAKKAEQEEFALLSQSKTLVSARTTRRWMDPRHN